MDILYQAPDREGGIARVVCRGAFEGAATALRVRLHTLCSVPDVELNLAGVFAIDAVGVQFLLLLLHQARSEHRRLSVTGIGPHLLELIGLLGAHVALDRSTDAKA